MEINAVISYYLDTRRAKSNGLYPVKLRVYNPASKVTKQYTTKFEFSKKEYASVWETNKPRQEHKETRLDMAAFERKANDAANLKVFTFPQFERRLYRHAGQGANVAYQYEQTIKTLRKNNQFGTASNYELSFKSFANFETTQHNSDPSKLTFEDITMEWLTAYELYMLEEKQLSRTTISMYLRTLRTIYNNAIAENEVEKELYPFGTKKYQIPSVSSVKKALNPLELKKLFEAKEMTPEQEKAKDFWFFSFVCNGINVKDIALLRYEDMKGESLVFYRAKTINTSKQNLRPITIYLTDFAKQVIEKYGNKKANSKTYIFPILSESMAREEQFTAIKNFTRFINQNLKKLASALELTTSISTYWARHSFATSAIRKGASIEFVGEALDHKNPKTTLGYFAGFEENSKRDIANSLLDF